MWGVRVEAAGADELDVEWREKMKGGIVAFELAVTRLDVKFKLSQNRSEADADGVIAGLEEGGEQDVSAAMRRIREG